MAAVLVACALFVPATALGAGDDKDVCAYSNHSIATLQAFGRLVHRTMSCALVYASSSDWASWASPWFLHHGSADTDWAKWATTPGTHRRLIITQDLIPAGLTGDSWRAPGAAGAYTSYARAFASNLVAAGLGSQTIRLAPEANGDWYTDSIGNTPQSFAQWVQFWRQTVIAMKSVPGAHFQFDWCVHAPYRPIPLAQYYPGDDVVDIIGVDAYDIGQSLPASAARWANFYKRPGGIGWAVAFAAEHNKPLSIPEWGLSPPTLSQGGGDDPAYINGIASVVRQNRTSYQGYFYKYSWATELSNGPLSLAAYISHFGNGGDAVPGTLTPSTRSTSSGSSKKRKKAAAAAAARLSAAAKTLARAGMSALVAHGRFRHRGSKVKLRVRVPVGAVACVVAFADRDRGKPPSATVRRAAARASCGQRAWAAGASKPRVLAAGSHSMIARQLANIVFRLHSSGMRKLRAGSHARVTVVAAIVPRSGRAAASALGKRVRTR